MFFEGEWKPAGPLWACEVAASVSKGSVSSTLCRGDNMSFSRSQNVMPGLDPRLSGLDLAYAEAHLNRTAVDRSEEHTSELQSLRHLVCRLLLEKKKSNPAHLLQRCWHHTSPVCPAANSHSCC